ncbi:MAG: nuclear transport factor 2 family protein [Actinomycetota bacterium]
MSQENVEIVRQPVAVKAHPRRRVMQHLALHFPWFADVLSRGVLRLSPHSRLRQVMLRDGVRRSFEAVNRGDYEAALVTLSPDCVSIPPRQFVLLGFDPVYRGREDRLRLQREWAAELGEFQQENVELIDCGDQVLVLARMNGTGLSSAAPFESQVAYLISLTAGRVVREQMFTSHGEALEVAGLRE